MPPAPTRQCRISPPPAHSRQFLTTFQGGTGGIGASTTDLQGIIAAIDIATVGNVVDATTHNPVTDPRKSIGVGSPLQLGSVYLKWNGNAAASLTMQNLQFAIANS